MGLKLLRGLRTHKNLEGEDCITRPRTQVVEFKKGDVIEEGDIAKDVYEKLIAKGYAEEDKGEEPPKEDPKGAEKEEAVVEEAPKKKRSSKKKD